MPHPGRHGEGAGDNGSVGLEPGERVAVFRGEAFRLGKALLVIHDEDDAEVPIACGEKIAHAWPGAELVRTRELGHRRILRDAKALQAVVRFVAQGRPTGKRSSEALITA